MGCPEENKERSLSYISHWYDYLRAQRPWKVDSFMMLLNYKYKNLSTV